MCKTETTSAFLSAIFIFGVMATPGDMYIIAIEEINPDNIDRPIAVVEFCFYVPQKPK